MKTVLTLSLLLASQCLYAQNESRPVNYECMERNCVTTPPLTIGNPDGFDWQGLPPGSGVRYPANGLQRSQSSFPTQVVNGDFNNTTAWEARKYYTGFATQSDFQLLFESDPGAPQGGLVVASPGVGNACPYLGTIGQKLHIGSNKRLSFNWKPTGFRGSTLTSPPAYRSVELEIKDAISGQIFFQGLTNYSAVGSAFHSEVDLSQYAGLDVEVSFRGFGCPGVFQSGPFQQPWVDSVRLTDGPAPNFSGSAVAGNWYNPSRSGSGWDLRRAPDGSYYAIWYTYDGGLQPIWYITSASTFVNGRFQATLLKCSRAFSGASCPSVGRVDLTLKSSTQGEMRFDFGNDGQWDGEEFFTLLTSAGGAYSGHFHSNDAADPAWGITTMSFAYQNQQNLFTTMYYYNGSEPTWAVGTGTVGNNTAVTMMRQSGGLCPQCVGSYPAITQQSVGSMSLNFTGSNPALIADLNISNWLRPSRPYYMLSN